MPCIAPHFHQDGRPVEVRLSEGHPSPQKVDRSKDEWQTPQIQGLQEVGSLCMKRDTTATPFGASSADSDNLPSPCPPSCSLGTGRVRPQSSLA